MTTKQILAGLLALVVLGGVFGGYRFLFSSSAPTVTSAAPAGATFSTAPIAEQTVNTSTTTQLAQTNTDSGDRTIVSADISIKGALSTSTPTTIACATSTSLSSLNGNTNYILNFTLAAATANQFGTTTGAGNFIGTSSPGVTGTTTGSVNATQNLVNPFARTWASGSNLVCTNTTGDGTNTFSAGTSGFISFSYRRQ